MAGAGVTSGGSRCLAIVILLTLTVAGSATPQDPGVVACGKCHGNPRFLFAGGEPAGPAVRLYVPDSLVRGSVHAELGCTGCHPGFGAGFPHRVQEKVLRCESCHQQEGRDWTASIHAANLQGDAATCIECHGSHTVYRAADRRSPTHALNVAELCGRCHADERIISTYFATSAERQARTAVREYFGTVHGAALTRDGLVVSATCNDCHRAHKVLPHDSLESSINRANVAATCGTCHLGILEVYEESAHGKAHRAGITTAAGYSAPVCVDCHPGHGIVRTDQPEWFIGVVEECGTCHEELYGTYFDTYHGKVTRLGFGLTAKCSDCHTAHNIRSPLDPESAVFPANLVSTCARCHPGANQNFVRYYTHGDHRDRERYPRLFWPWVLMSTLLAAVFGFFGLHTLLWLSRVAINRIRRPPDNEHMTDATMGREA